ncbi:MAG: 16S rRNA (cytosine(1402)-N(4))-methyltransferase RsmH [Pseudobdellovibrionaceae bacterium]
MSDSTPPSQPPFPDLTKVEFAPEHYPVMVREILENFAVFRGKKDLRYFDGTFGRGGHLRAMLANFPQLQAVVMDQDETAIKFGMENFKTEVESRQVRIIHGNFSEFQEHNLGSFDMMLLDLGVSSPQLDTAERGFSFNKEGPLDMRMNQTQGITAEYILNTASEQELNDMFKEYGEIHRPFRVVRAIVHDRKTKAWQSTKELAGLIERVDGWRHKGFHPATQYFMALRLRVNSELQVLEHALPALMQSLRPGGRLAVISFHSLEDRIVKNIFKSHKDLGAQTHKRVLLPTQEECDMNSRSRSAKLRVFERKVQDELREF